jgi:hypothetical protein
LTRRSVLVVVATAFAVGGLWTGAALALPCSVSGNAWNPDPSVANSSVCGAGDAPATPPNDANNNAFNVTLNGISFTEWDKDGDASLLLNGDDDFFITGTTTSGFWYWNATDSLAEGNDVFALVLKGGNVPGVATKWAWFILDNPSGPESTWLTNPLTAGGCESDSSAPAAGTFTQCGTWSMYGRNGILKDLSHVSLYGADTLPELPEPPPPSVPEPGTLLVLSLGLAGVAVASRLWRTTR